VKNKFFGLVILISLILTTGLWAAGEGEGAAEEVTVTYMRSEHPSSPMSQDAPVFQEIQRKTGITVKLEVVPGSDFDTKANLMLGTGQIPDIMRLRSRTVNSYADSGVFLPLNDPIKNGAPNLQAILDSIKGVKKTFIDGTMYYVPQLSTDDKKLMGPIPMIRRDLLDDLGLQMPDSFDELYTVLKKFKQEWPESHPWSNRSGTKNLLNRTGFPMGKGWNIHWVPREDRWVYGTVDPEFKKILEYHRRNYEEGILDPDYNINTSSQWQEKMSSGKSLYYHDNMTFSLNYTLAQRKVKPDALFWPVPIMENMNGNRQNYFYSKHWFTSGFVVDSQSEVQDAVIRLFDWMASEEGLAITNWGIENEHWTRESDGSIEATQSVLDTYRGASDPQRAMRSGIGTGLLQFTLLVNQKPIYYFDPSEVTDWYAQVNADPNMILPVIDPPFSEDERERLKRLKTDVDNILNPALDGFILGTLPLSDFDKVMQQAIDAGAKEIEQIYNAAEDRLR